MQRNAISVDVPPWMGVPGERGSCRQADTPALNLPAERRKTQFPSLIESTCPDVIIRGNPPERRLDSVGSVS